MARFEFTPGSTVVCTRAASEQFSEGEEYLVSPSGTPINSKGISGYSSIFEEVIPLAKFKLGDEVRRITGTYCGMVKGDVAIVTLCKNSVTMSLSKWGAGHSPGQFELANPLGDDADTGRELVDDNSAASIDDITQAEINAGNLPDVAQERKDTPVYSGVLKYFPLALQEVARCSKVGNDQHNPGEPLHWARGKSGDELDALTRHLLEAGTIDTDGVRHSTKVAWRSLANLEKELERAEDELRQNSTKT